MASSKEIINELLVDVFNHILSIEETTLKKRGVTLSMTEVHVLEAIKDVEVGTMGNVAKKLRVTLGTLTTSVNGLVKKGYVHRYRDESDRRKVYLELTEKANKVLTIHDEFHDEMIDSLFEELELDKDEAIMKSLESISEFFKSKY